MLDQWIGSVLQFLILIFRRLLIYPYTLVDARVMSCICRFHDEFMRHDCFLGGVGLHFLIIPSILSFGQLLFISQPSSFGRYLVTIHAEDFSSRARFFSRKPSAQASTPAIASSGASL